MEYRVHQSKLIKKNHRDFVETSFHLHDKYFTNIDSTWTYQNYNIFQLSSSYEIFYWLLKELNYHIRSYIGDNRPLWFQSWLNFHSSDEVLKEHDHEWDFHGYISIDPKDTTTVFKEFQIKNKIGQIYIGPGGPKYSHYVKVDSPYEGKRITLGFDVTTQKNLNYNNISLIPLI